MTKLATILPQKADLAIINFTDSGKGPQRDGDRIILPFHPRAEFCSLQDGKQFLYLIPHTDTYHHDDPIKEVWFGGTDERPFLVQVRTDILKTFQEGGEEAFYNALKPDSIKKLEEALKSMRQEDLFPLSPYPVRWGEVKFQARRQGDIFALPLPISWEEIERYIFFVLGRDPSELINTDVEKRSLFETRHLFAGRIWQTAIDGKERTTAEGVIRAPDHAPLSITGQPHLLAQAVNLVDPKNVD